MLPTTPNTMYPVFTAVFSKNLRKIYNNLDISFMLGLVGLNRKQTNS